MTQHRVYIRSAERLADTIAEIFRVLRLTRVRGKKVFVKPNMLKAARPDEAAVTDPCLISETVLFLNRLGADVRVGDNPVPNQQFSEMTIAEACGYIEASHGRFKNIGKYSRKIHPQGLLKRIYVSREILNCDMLVSLPKFKTHDLTTMSLAVKNHFGIVPGGQKPFIHSMFPRINDFSRVLLEIYNIRPPDIIIVDLLNVADARGKIRSPGKLVAGTNGHAVDYVCSLLAGVHPMAVPTIKIAIDEGLLQPENIVIDGPFERLSGYSMPVWFPFRTSVVEFVGRLLYRLWLRRKPVINKTKCTDCLACNHVCPCHAINNSSIDYRACIKCYCCLEVCPEQAISAQLKL
jgi:uncharacterized protein (DUF362 family)/Pyruvate/2-oxoacid:ferredoxin oxidoreductase delta subunit